MKLVGAAACVALGLVMAGSARGDLFWDSDGATAGGSANTVAPGTWGTSNFWSTDSTGAAATGAWVAGENAIFSAGTDVTGTYAVTVNGTQSVGNITIQEGTLTFNGGELALGGGVITTPNALTINSVISGSSGLTKLGAGTLTLNGANTYSGTTIIWNSATPATNAGIIVAANSSALGTSDVVFGTPTTANAYTGRLYLTNNITLANNITVTNGSANSAGPGQIDNLSGNNTITGTISIAGGVQNSGSGLPTIGAQAGTLTLSGVMQNGAGPAFGWAKVGPGTVVLTGTSPNTYTGITRLFGGYLIAEKDQAFGAGVGGVFVLSGGYLTESVGLRAPAGTAGFDYSTPETGLGGLNLSGFSNDALDEGLFHNFGGDNSYAGDVMLSNVTQSFTVPTMIGATAGSSMTVNGHFENTVATPPNTSFRNLTKVGGGTLVMVGQDTHIGTTIVSNGTLVYKSTQTNTTTGTWNPSGPAPSFAQVGPNGTLRFDNTDRVETNRFIANANGAPMPLNVDGGKFELVGNAAADVFQGTIGAGLNAVGDASFNVINPSSSLPEDQPRFTTSLGVAPSDPNPVVGGIIRSNRGTMLLRGTSLGTAATGVSQIFLDDTLNVPVGEAGGTGTKVGILPFATGDASGTAGGATGFVTYGPNGVRHLDEATEYAPGITSGSTDLVNVTMNAPQAVSTDTAVNSIRMTTGGNAIVISDLAGLSVNSGAILNASTDAASIRNGTLNFGGAEGVITTVGDMNITSVIMGSNGVTKSGRGNLTLGADNQFSGPLTVNGGNVIFNSQNQLGPTPAGPINGTVVLNGGFLKPQGSMTLDAARGITLSSAYTGVDIASGETFTIPGTIDGTGTLTKRGAGTLVLSGSNNHSGGFNFDAGVVSINDDSQLGSTAVGGTNGILTFNGGTLRITGSTTINTNRGVYFTTRGGTIEVADGQEVTSPLYMSGPGGLTKSGGGTLVLQGFSAQSAQLGVNTVNGGTLAYVGTNGLGINPPILLGNYWTLSNGATLQNRTTNGANVGMGAANRGITLSGAGKLDTPGNVLWNLSQVIGGTGTLTKTGDGEARLLAINTYNGKTAVNGGTLSMAADNRLGAVVTAADSITLDGGTLNALGTFTLTTGRGIKLGANNGGLRVAPTFTLTYGGAISGTGNLTKDDTGTLVLTGNSTYSGTTALNAGVTRINGTFSGGGDMTVAGGATLQGTGTIQSNVAVQGGAHLAPGVTVGTMTMTGLALDNSLLDFEGNATGFDRINVTGADKFTLANNSTINLTDLGGVVGGNEYVLIDYAGAPLTDISGLSLSSPTLGTQAVQLYHDTANTQIKLRVAAGGPPQWNVDADGSWGNNNNWSTFVQPNSPTDIANFLGKITAARTVTLDGDKTVNQINFSNTNSYTIAPGTGGSLTVTGSLAGINVDKGNHVINAPVTFTDDTSINVSGAGNGLRLDGGLSIAAGKTVAKKSDGTLTINGAQTHGAGAALQVGQGTVNLVSNAGTVATAASAAGANLAISVFNGGGSGSIVLGSHQDVKEASVTYTDAGLQGLDLASPADAGAYHALRIYAADVDATKAAMSNAVHNATLNAGDGVYDSGLASHPGSAIGVGVVTDAHGDKLTMVRATRIGDLNLDGSVTISDFIDLASNFNSSGAGVTWQEGDLNGDSAVTISDFIDLASNFNGSYSGPAGAINPSDAQTLASFASSLGVDPSVIGSAVPEPGTLGLLAIGTLGLVGRRRRK
jgi:fibronectin-binding autotransporter adhesin